MRFSKTTLALAATLALVSCQPAHANVVGILGGHYSKHLLSEDIPNERHAWVSIRYNWLTIGRFDNSYKQKGFSGESYHVGVVHDFKLWEDVNDAGGDVVLKASAGLVRGYTEFDGHNETNKRKIFLYAAGGPFFQQKIGYDGLKVEGGIMFLGEAAVPSAGFLYTF